MVAWNWDVEPVSSKSCNDILQEVYDNNSYDNGRYSDNSKILLLKFYLDAKNLGYAG